MIFSIENGCFHYDEKSPVFHDISFGLEQGDIVAVLGPNGIGKTTLLKCMLGFQKLDSGKITYCDQDLQSMNPHQFAQQVSYVPQAHRQSFPYLVKETVLMGRSPYLGMFQMPTKEDERIAQECIEKTGIQHLVNKSCNEISGGELQLVLIARALAATPKILVMDEPETGLDFKNQLQILQMIQKLSKEEHLSILFNTHYPENAYQIANKTLLLAKDGSSLFGTTKEIIKEKTMQEAFGVKIRMIEQVIDHQSYMGIYPISIEEDTK